MLVYLLSHTRVRGDGTEDDKLLGVYSTRDMAEARITSASALPGFRDTPDGFEISEYTVDQDEWSEGYGN